VFPGWHECRENVEQGERAGCAFLELKHAWSAQDYPKIKKAGEESPAVEA
jgi:hypothetical protein